LEQEFQFGLETQDPARISTALLELDRLIWEASRDLENEEFISQAREILREWYVLLGIRISETPQDTADCLAPVVEEMLDLRRRLRGQHRWEDADAIRECLLRANVLVEDTPEGSRWRLQPPADTSIGESGAKGARR
jgi:cysteinyl-tRNA synthetase